MDSRRCPRCRAQTLTGTEDVKACALPYRLDPVPLAGPAGELAALRAGRRTWTVEPGGHVRLRTTRSIRRPAEGRMLPPAVHADHACERREP